MTEMLKKMIIYSKFTWLLVSERCNTLGKEMPVSVGRDIGAELVSRSSDQKKMSLLDPINIHSSLPVHHWAIP